MQRNAIETIMGAVVLVIAGAFVAFAYQTSQVNAGKGDGYHVKAAFTNVTGVGKGSDVRIGGVKIGVVEAIELSRETYEAMLHLAIVKDVALPADTTASITSEGLLGNKFVALQPGADEAMLKEGGVIQYTQPSVSLEELIGKFVFSGGGVDKGEAAPSEDAAGADAAEPELSLP